MGVGGVSKGWKGARGGDWGRGEAYVGSGDWVGGLVWFGSGGGVGAGLTRAGFVGVDDFEVGHFWGGGSEVEGAVVEVVVVVVGRNSAVEVGGWLWRGKMEGLERSGEEFLVRAEHGWDFCGFLFLSCGYQGIPWIRLIKYQVPLGSCVRRFDRGA